MNTIEQVSGLLRNSIAAARAKGFRIVRGLVIGPANTGACCCAVGSIATDVPIGEPRYQVICDRLGLDLNCVLAIARGFDGAQYDPSFATPDWHALGERLRGELKEGTL